MRVHDLEGVSTVRLQDSLRILSVFVLRSEYVAGTEAGASRMGKRLPGSFHYPFPKRFVR